MDSDNIEVLLELGDILEQCLTHENVDSRFLTLDKYPISVYGGFKLHEPSDKLILVAEHIYTKALILDPSVFEAHSRRKRLAPLVEEIDSLL